MSSFQPRTKVAMTREEIDEKKKRWLEEKAKEQLRKRIEENLIQPTTHVTCNSSQQTSIPTSLVGILTDTVEQSMKEEMKISHALKYQNHDEDDENFLANEMENHKCAICFELMLDKEHEPMMIVPCGHCFCRNCLQLLTTQKCPTCRSRINSLAVNFALKQVISSYNDLKAQKEKKKQEMQTFIEKQSAHIVDPSVLEIFKMVLNRTPSEHRQEVEKYLSQYAKAKTRKKILIDSLSEIEQEVGHLTTHLSIAESHLQRFNNEHQALVQEIEEKMKNLEELKKAIDEQNRVTTEISQHKQQMEQKKQFILQSVQSIDREREKAKLIIKNFVPNISDYEFND
ncbi:hypothetical protein C9374_009648 [Naegleria lovaniensis]|uniref:RING-type domain-containing protein n=1 Tax=Naegleria lovaniensis TaxID=51637 RepID=A0AA88H5B0_NAELO|nr:uncharacterized protein C9374_009648 [Naegleria lovaniensis]KAG2393071.1 hypothetical protein C9374_009648 [Naegleria lovaniensis]